MDKAINLLCKELNFKKHIYRKNGKNGWIIPPKWEVLKAEIRKDGELIYDGMAHPLCVIALSEQFIGKVELEELKRHLHYDHRSDGAIPYHFRQEYRCWDRTWGLCIPKALYDMLEDGEYEIEIRTKESRGYLTVLECTHKGSLKDAIAFVAHIDHPAMANDDLSGCIVGIELFNKLKSMKTKLTYKLIITEEIMGSEAFLQEHAKTSNIKEAMFLEMLGSKTPLNLQKSSKMSSLIERAMINTLRTYAGDFGSGITNDETTWESHGIPMCSLSRYPYEGYHSNRDNMEIISEGAMDDAVGKLLATIKDIEHETWIEKKFTGMPCLSNPKFNLYIDPGQPAFGTANENIHDMRKLMDAIPMMPKVFTLEQLQWRCNAPKESILSYLSKMQKKHLIKVYL